MIGATLLHYEILEELGRGGMGVVYKARDTKLERDVALKFLPQDQSVDARDRFLREARAASRLNHKNIVAIHAIEQAERDFIVMEYVDGSSLRDIVSGGDVPVERAVEITADLADALAKAHEAGIVHRDIKPDNILLTRDGLPKILDFGIAKMEGSERLTQTDATLGTVAYMSPEQSRGEAIDGRSDLFSLGVILYEMIAGVSPFKGDYSAATTFKILNEDPAPLTNHRPDVPEYVQAVVSKLLEKDPAARYQSGREVIEDLKSGTTSVSAAASETQTTVTGATGSRFRLRPTWAVPGLIAVGLLVAWPFLTQGPSASSIAVLPFENTSNDDEVAFLCDGIPESLINRLSLIPDFKVISRASSFSYRDLTSDPRVIGAELGVQTLLMGRLDRRGDELSIRAELVDVSDSRQIWGERFTRPSSDVLKIEDEIAASIADRLRLEFSPEAKHKIEVATSVDPKAYELYLKGRFTIVGSNDEMDQAIEYFREATRIDPTYAAAWAGIAEGLAIQAYLTVETREVLMGEARAALETALAHDQNASEAYVAKGLLNFYLDWDWNGAIDALERAIALNPGNAAAYNRYADVLLALGRMDEALAMSLKSKELDPISVSPTHDLGWLYFVQGKFDLAEDQFAAARGLHPDWTWGYVKGGLSNAYLGNRARTIELMDVVEEQTDGWGSDLIQSWVVLSYAIVGETTRAQFVFDRMQERAKSEPMDGIAMGEALVGLGRYDEALDWLERSIDEHSPTAVWLKAVSGTIFAPIAATERYRRVVERMGFP